MHVAHKTGPGITLRLTEGSATYIGCHLSCGATTKCTLNWLLWWMPQGCEKTVNNQGTFLKMCRKQSKTNYTVSIFSFFDSNRAWEIEVDLKGHGWYTDVVQIYGQRPDIAVLHCSSWQFPLNEESRSSTCKKMAKYDDLITSLRQGGYTVRIFVVEGSALQLHIWLFNGQARTQALKWLDEAAEKA